MTTAAQSTATVDEAEIDRAVALLRAGELVAIPTETVYGLAADAANPQAVATIFAAKGRPADHPLIVHLASAAAIDRWARDIPPAARLLAAAFWPGPLTLILKRQPGVIDAVTGGQDTVGLRVPNHPVTLALLREFDAGNSAGLAAPSANRYGRISPTCAEHVRAELGDRVSLILDGGPCAVGIESTIVDLSSGAPRILRPGFISATDIARVLGDTPQDQSSKTDEAAIATPRVSGSLAAHYAPHTPLRRVAGEQLAAAVQAELLAGQRVAVLASTLPEPFEVVSGLVWQTASNDAESYAHDLYANLRMLDAAACNLILVEAPPSTPEWLAVNDRLQRAACGSGASE